MLKGNVIVHMFWLRIFFTSESDFLLEKGYENLPIPLFKLDNRLNKRYILSVDYILFVIKKISKLDQFQYSMGKCTKSTISWTSSFSEFLFHKSGNARGLING